MKTKHLIFLPFLLLFFVFQSCQEEQIVEQAASPNNTKTTTDNSKTSQAKKGLGKVAIGGDPQVITWVRIGYVNVSDSVLKVGIYPKNIWIDSTLANGYVHNEIVQRLRKKWGFNVICTGSQNIRFVEHNGFNPASQHVMALVDPNRSGYVSTDFSGHNANNYCWAYYADEPESSTRNPYYINITVGEARNELIEIKNFLNQRIPANARYGTPPSGLFMTGETMKVLAHSYDDLVDYVTMTSYDHYWYSTLGPIPIDKDQRCEWEDFAYAFGAKFELLWMSGEKDMGEFTGLVEWAHNWGRPWIFLYAGQEGHGDGDYYNEISDFCDKAFHWNYLWARERQYINGIKVSTTRIVNVYGQEVRRENYTDLYDN